MLKFILPLIALSLLAPAALEASTPIENMKEEVNFLRDNRERPGVRETDSGLQYEIVKPGTGRKPSLTSRVRVHYRGTLLNGKVFDSSYKNGGPAVFQVNRVIEGWTEALQMMQEGAVWKLYVPSKIAYGGKGSPPVIGPNQCIQFTVELIEIVE